MSARAITQPPVRAAVWAAVRARQRFSCSELLTDAVAARSSLLLRDVWAFVRTLERAGIVERIGREPTGARGRIVYELRRDVGRAVPKLAVSGQMSQHGQRQRNLWRSMRILREFTLLELRYAAQTKSVRISYSLTATYVRLLYRAGYLVQTRPPGRVIAAKYRLPYQCNTGPLAPGLRDGKLYDHNTQRVIYDPAEDDSHAA